MLRNILSLSAHLFSPKDVFSIHVRHGKDKLKFLDRLKSKDVSRLSFHEASSLQIWAHIPVHRHRGVTNTYHWNYNNIAPNSEFYASPDVEPEDMYNWTIENGYTSPSLPPLIPLLIDPFIPHTHQPIHFIHRGLLACMKWYRVTVDEAQFLRKRNTKASKALAALPTTHP